MLYTFILRIVGGKFGVKDLGMKPGVIKTQEYTNIFFIFVRKFGKICSTAFQSVFKH